MKSSRGSAALLAGAVARAAMRRPQAKKEPPSRPVLVAAVHYAPRAAARAAGRHQGEDRKRSRLSRCRQARRTPRRRRRHRQEGRCARPARRHGFSPAGGSRPRPIIPRQRRARADAGRRGADGTLKPGLVGGGRRRQGQIRRRSGARRRRPRRARGGAGAQCARLCDAARRRRRHRQRGAGRARPGVGAGAPVIRLSHTGEMEAAVAIPETLVDRARSARRASSSGRCRASRSTPTLRELSPNADPATRTYQARYALPTRPPGRSSA